MNEIRKTSLPASNSAIKRWLTVVGAAVLFLLPVGPAPAATPATLEFETQQLDLETGTILQLDDPEAALSESNDGDIHFAYNADRTPHCVVMQSQSGGAAVAFLNATAFEAVSYDDVAGLTFTSEIIDQPFGSDDTVVVRTAAGNHYKVGHASESDTAVTFDYELLAEPVAALQPAAEASLELLASAPPAPEIPAGLSSKDWRRIRSHLEQASYHVVRGASSRDQVAPASFQANNRRHKMRTVFDSESVRVIPTGGDQAAWEWGLKLRAYGYEGSTRAPQAAELAAVGNRLEYRRGDLVEWYINDGRGLEQGFTLSEQPGKRGDRDLLIELEFDGSLSPDWKQGSEAIAFNDSDGETVLRYGELLAWDVGGRHLPVALAARKDGFALRVDDREAVYPITIDPTVTNETVKLLASDGAAADVFGFSVAVSGDTAVVGAVLDDDNGVNSGSAYVFQRDAGGVGMWGEVTKLLASDGAAVDLFGHSVAVSGGTAVVGASLDGVSGSGYVFAFDSAGPLTSDVMVTPNPASVAQAIILSAKLDDTETGGATVVSAEYEIRDPDGILVASGAGDNTDCPSPDFLCPVDGAGMPDPAPTPFDAVMENVQVTIPVGTVATLGPGVYEACVRGTDANGNVGDFDQDGACTFLVIYDPDGGFVTGGGWITSPAGAYKADESLSGKANFGFVSKYNNGASVPTGQTQFRFKTGDLNFHGSAYEWLVIAGPLAQYKGSGTINGAGDYGFLLTAKDSAINGGPATDTFRIKIWDKDNGEAVVYDNGTNQPIDQGSIVIHQQDAQDIALMRGAPAVAALIRSS